LEPHAVGVSLLSIKPGMIGGLASYVRQVARCLAQRNPERFIYFVPRALERDWRTVLPQSVQLHTCDVDSRSTAFRALFEAFRLPRIASKCGCSVLFYPNTAAPISVDPVPVVTVHDVMYLSQPNDMPWHRAAYLSACYAVIRQRNVRVVTISDFCKRDIAQRTGIGLENIRPIHSGVDDHFFNPELEGPRPAEIPDAPYLLSVAAAYPHKRLPVVVDVFERVARRHPDLYLVLAGSVHGSDAQQGILVDRIEASPMRERIVRLGRIDWESVPRLYRDATMLVHASRFEGFGFPVAEAMASGTPVAAAPADGVVEVLAGHGEIASDWTPDALAAAVERILAWEPAVRQARTAAARAWAQTRYRWDRVAEQLENEFSQAAASRR